MDVPHRQVVFTIPEMLRVFFKYKRQLLGDKSYEEKSEYRDWEYADNGSINKYLIDTYGIPKYLEFWKLLRTNDYDANIRALKIIYDKEAKEIEMDWMEFLRKYKEE